MKRDFRLGVDVGGTFTDVVLLSSDGKAFSKKVLSSPPDFSIAIKRAVCEILSEQAIPAGHVAEYTHGATVATNAIITRTGARAGLITSKGFGDVLEIGRMRMSKLYELNWEKPKPLIPRALRCEVRGRMDPSGREETPLDERASQERIQALIENEVESIAVCLLHSYANGRHEERVRDMITQVAPQVYVSISSEILPEIKEYERTSTTVINAYVQPIVSRYFLSMERDLKEMGMSIPIMVMQSNGGMMPSELARERPIHIIESGPAAGVTGCFHLANRLGLKDVMTFDMGGTTAKAALIEDGEISRSPEYEVGGKVSIGHRLMKGSGHLLRVPSVDLAEVGAGGGSIAWVDNAGALRVGPHSAGADPGPACYGAGGKEPTTTDANVVLGLTNPDSLAGGSLKIHRDLADEAIRKRIADRLGIDLTAAAWGIRQVANSSLIRALRAVSTERGRDPRRFVLMAFGGMGPVHAVDVATELSIGKVIIPILPGLYSSLGLLYAQVEHHLIRTLYCRTDEIDETRINKVASAILEEAEATLSREGYTGSRQSITLLADVRYIGQDYALTIPLREHVVSRRVVEDLVKDLHEEHDRTYGYRVSTSVAQIVALRCVARGVPASPRMPASLVIGTHRPSAPERRAYFGPHLGWITVPTLSRADLSEKPQSGPMIVEEDNSITIVPPGWDAAMDQLANIVLERSR